VAFSPTRGGQHRRPPKMNPICFSAPSTGALEVLRQKLHPEAPVLAAALIERARKEIQ
jgi:hypothetical protein